MTPAARVAAAIELLDAIAAAPRRPADAVATEFFRARRFIGGGDRREVSTLVWDVLRARLRLGWWLARAGAAPDGRLLVGAHMLLAGGVRLEGLRTLFSGGRYAAGSLDTPEARALAALDGHTLDHPAMDEATALELPPWLLAPLRARFGERLAAELAALGEPAPLDLRVNLLRGTRDEAAAALRGEGFDAAPTPLSPWGLRLPPRTSVTAGEAFRTGLVEIQDEGSQLIALAVAAAPGERVCDYCAGAGGKTLALAATMANRGSIAACDTSATRLEGATRRLRRAGVHNCERHLLEPGDKWRKRRAGAFDRVLVDAPCTGTGTWRRHPDGRARLAENDLAELVERQRDILRAAATLVRPGGRLVYATCSLLPAENEQQVERFVSDGAPFRPVAVRGLGLPGEETMALTPARHGTDGFFAAVLERAG